jgi:hypothetical protein
MAKGTEVLPGRDRKESSWIRFECAHFVNSSAQLVQRKRQWTNYKQY